MLSRRTGHIVNVASVAASFGVAGMAAYCASKYAMLGFSESLLHELHGTGVRITVVSPIGVKTNFFNNKSFLDCRPNYTGLMLSPKTVSRAIISASCSPRFEIVVLFLHSGCDMVEIHSAVSCKPIGWNSFQKTARMDKKLKLDNGYAIWYNRYCYLTTSPLIYDLV